MFSTIFFIFYGLEAIFAEHAIIKGFDCDVGHITTTFASSESFCTGVTIKNKSSITVNLLQKSKKIIHRALKCSMSVSTSTHVCGEFSHNHVIDANTISQRILLDKDECVNAFVNKHIIYEGKFINVEPNKDIRRKFFLNGSITLTTNMLNQQIVSCYPKGIFLNGIFIIDGYMSAEISFFMTEIDVLETDIGYFSIDSNIFIGNCSSYCNYNGETLVLLTNNSSMEDKIFNSGFRFITTLKVERFKIGKYVFIQNTTNNVYLKIKDKFSRCFNNYCVRIYKTEIQDLFVFVGKNIFPAIRNFEIIDGIEIKLEITSEARFIINIIEHQPFLINMCKSMASPVDLRSSYEFFGQIIEFKGELIAIHKCKEMFYEISLHELWPCYKNTFVFVWNDHLLGLSPFTRIIFEVDLLKKIDCESHPTFLSMGDGKFIVNLGRGMEIKFFSQTDTSFWNNNEVSALYTNKERIQTELMVNRRFEEIKNNLYLSQLTPAELDILQIEKGFWDEFSGWLSSFDFLDPFTWVKIFACGLIAIIGIFLTGWIMIFLFHKLINIKCFERHEVFEE